MKPLQNKANNADNSQRGASINPPSTGRSSFETVRVLSRSRSVNAPGSSVQLSRRRKSLGAFSRSSSSRSSRDSYSRSSLPDASLDGKNFSVQHSTVDEGIPESSISRSFSSDDAVYRKASTAKEEMSHVPVAQPEIGQSDSLSDDLGAVDLPTAFSSAASGSLPDKPGFPSTLAAIQSGRVLVEPSSSNQEPDSAAEIDKLMFRWVKEETASNKLENLGNIQDYAVPSPPQPGPLAHIEEQRGTDGQGSHSDTTEVANE